MKHSPTDGLIYYLMDVEEAVELIRAGNYLPRPEGNQGITLVAEVELLRAAVTRVRELHSETSPISGGCPVCMADHPCPTVRALDGET